MFYFFLLSIFCRHIFHDVLWDCVLLPSMFLMGDKECCIQREERGERDKEIETDRHTQRSCLWIVCVCAYFLLWIHCCKCTPIYMNIYYLTTLDEWLNLYLYGNFILCFKNH